MTSKSEYTVYLKNAYYVYATPRMVTVEASSFEEAEQEALKTIPADERWKWRDVYSTRHVKKEEPE